VTPDMADPLSVSEDKKLNEAMKRNKSINICQIILGILIIQSCSTPKNNHTSNQILKSECDSVILEEFLLEGDTYPAIARENKVEAIIRYKILIEEKIIHLSIIDANYITINRNKTENKQLLLNDIFTKSLKRKLNSKCSNKLKNGNYQIIIAYKLKESNFSPNPNEFDILIQREKVKLIEQSSH